MREFFEQFSFHGAVSRQFLQGIQSVSERLTSSWKFFLFVFVLIRFALQGNVLDLAIGIIIGAAFTRVVQSLVDDILTPPLGLVIGGVDFANLTIGMKNYVFKDQPPVVIRYGKFIQSLISLLLIALVLFFIVKAINRLHQLAKRSKAKDETSIPLDASDEVRVLCEIRDLLARQIPK